MVKGSCACGDWTYEFEGEPIFTASAVSNFHARYSQLIRNQGMCHCNWCRKTSGHNGNTFIVIMDSAFKQLSGTDSTFARTADSGNPMKSYACAKCSTLMWVRSEAKPHIRMIRSGTIDDQEMLNNLKPQKELYCSFRPASFAEYPGIAHEEKM